MSRMSRREGGKLPPRPELADLLSGSTPVDVGSALLALGVLDVVQRLAAVLIASGAIDAERIKADLRRDVDLRSGTGDRIRALPSALLLDALAHARREGAIRVRRRRS